LSFKDAIKTSSPKLYDKAMTLLLGLYYFYRKSPTQKKALKRSFKALNMSSILPKRVGGTRWLPHTCRAISAFMKGYKAIINQLETCSHTNLKAEGYAKLALDGNVICYILILKVYLYKLFIFPSDL